MLCSHCTTIWSYLNTLSEFILLHILKSQLLSAVIVPSQWLDPSTFSNACHDGWGSTTLTPPTPRCYFCCKCPTPPISAGNGSDQWFWGYLQLISSLRSLIWHYHFQPMDHLVLWQSTWVALASCSYFTPLSSHLPMLQLAWSARYSFFPKSSALGNPLFFWLDMSIMVALLHQVTCLLVILYSLHYKAFLANTWEQWLPSSIEEPTWCLRCFPQLS